MLSKTIKQRCLDDIKLFCLVAVATDKKPGATLRMIHRNSAKDLATVHVVKAISDYTGLTQDEILQSENKTH